MYPGNFGLGPVAVLGEHETLTAVLMVGSEHTTKEPANLADETVSRRQGIGLGACLRFDGHRLGRWCERFREITAPLGDRVATVVQRYGGTVDELTGAGIAAGARRPAAYRRRRWRGADELCGCRISLSTLGRSRSWASEFLLAIDALFGGWRMTTAVLAGLALVLTWLAIGVHFHGWVTAFDAATASWIGNSVHRSHRLDEASLITTWLGTPVKVAAAGLIGGALLAWRAGSLRTGVVVIGTVVGAALANTAIRVVVYRPLTQAEIHASPLLSTEHHPFPSGHVAGIGALLGIIAACIAVGRSRIVQALATALVVAGVLIVAFSRLYVGVHWLSDVIGGALVAGVFVILGAVALTTRSDRSIHASGTPGAA
jgi:undecaprenyl-diphosphatase